MEQSTLGRELTGQPLPKFKLENVTCYQCGKSDSRHFIEAEDDLTGVPGKYRFVTCTHCELSYQNPRIDVSEIGQFYDNDYIAHRKKKNWGILTPFYERAMEKHDRQKTKIVEKYVSLHSRTRVLDVGCAVGSFLGFLKKKFNVQPVGVDFKDLKSEATNRGIDFRLGKLSDQKFAESSFDLITMWHFLEHDYEPLNSLKMCSKLLADDGRLVIEVPRLDSLSYQLFKERWPGLQAPQHTVLFSKKSFLEMIENANLEVVDYMPWGAFPAYFYFFAGFLFKKNKGAGVNFDKVLVPYFLGQQLSYPFFMFEKKLNLAMQTVVCKKKMA